MKSFVNSLILVPVDLSEASDRALDYAKDLVADPGQITALHVGLPYAVVEPGYMYPAEEAIRRTQLEEAVHRHLKAERFRGVKVEIRYGSPGHEIAEFAKERNFELIVMPSRGRTGLAHLLIGSVAERVVRYSPCPVLVLRGSEIGVKTPS